RAAPTGTPIHSVGDGVVSFVGQEEIDGKTVKIRHSNGVESGYFHLSRYARGLIIGSKISQGEVIGYVGSSGDSQEPHLDYRVWIGGVEVDPLSLPPRSLEPIRESNKEAFLRERDRVVAELDEI
ncbi:MAG: M23 family metallopeptidase, partial [Rikenellaceae bacterium]